MDHFLGFLRDLLKPYIDQYKLSFMITDNKGMPVDDINGSNLAFLDYLQEVLLEPYGHVITKLTNISIPVSYDIQIPGIQILVIPVKNINNNEYYIWTGALLEEHNSDLIFEYLSRATKNPVRWSAIFIQMPMIPSSELELLTSRLNRIALLASQFLTTKNNEIDCRNHMNMIQQITTMANYKVSLNLPNLLSSILENTKGIQFCGYAIKVDIDMYSIIEIVGRAARVKADLSQLIGTEFTSGEGFLGQIGLFDQYRSLQSVDDDPRLSIFQQKGIHPFHMYGAPVRDESGVCGIIFAGTMDRHIHFSELTMLTLQVITDLYGSSLVLESNRTSLRRHKAYLSALTEVSRVMNTVRELRRLLFMLIDISLNLVDGANASYLIYHEPGTSKAQIVSRGISSEHVERYTQELQERNPEKNTIKRSLLTIRNTYWGAKVLECQILCRGEIRGLLAISLPNPFNIEEYKVIFETYIYLAGIALERIIGEEQSNLDKTKVNLLHDALGCWSQEGFQVAEQLKESAVDFASFLQLSIEHIKSIKLACLISAYPLAFIQEQKLSQNLFKLREELEAALSGDTTDKVTYYSLPCQIILLSMNEQTVENPILVGPYQLQGIEPYVKQKFIEYKLKDQAINFEISLDPSESSAGNLIDFTALQRTLNISAREKEVLELIVQGSNNHEIAEALFISEHTVKNHITKLFQKLKVTDRAQAIALAYKVGFHPINSINI